MTGTKGRDFAPWAQRSVKRRFRRWSVEIAAFIEVDATSHYCTITDISPGGARIRLLDREAVVLGTRASLDLEGYGVIPADVRYSASGVLGLMFLLHDLQQVELARWLVSNDLSRPDARYACSLEATIRVGGGKVRCVVTDLSRTGAGITVQEAGYLVPSKEVLLSLSGHPPIPALIRYVVGEKVGLTLIDGYAGQLPPPET